MTFDWKDAAQRHKDAFLKDLRSFLSINSVEDMSTAGIGRPFGKGVGEALQFVLDKAAADGFFTKDVEGYAGVVEYGNGDDADAVGVLAHVDVVPAGEGWTTPPFQPDIRDGRIYARGAIDDKGPLLTAYYALKIVRESGLPLARKVRLIAGTDEESGWLCMKRFNELDVMPDIGFSPDADFPIVHAEKGQINCTLVVPGRAKSKATGVAKLVVSSFSAGERGNMVPDSAVATVSGSDTDDLVSAFAAFAGKYGLTHRASTASDNRFHLELQGRAAHGMAPQEGVNAGLYLGRFLYEYGGETEAYFGLIADYLWGDFYGEKLMLACEDEATGKLTVNAGVFSYSDGDAGRVQLNIRYPATADVTSLTTRLQSFAVAQGWDVSGLRTSASHYVPKDHTVVRTLQRAYEAQTGQPAALLSTGGATYAKCMPHGVAFGAVFPGREMTAHQRDEYAIVDDLVLAMSIYAEAIYELAASRG